MVRLCCFHSKTPIPTPAESPPPSKPRSVVNFCSQKLLPAATFVSTAYASYSNWDLVRHKATWFSNEAIQVATRFSNEAIQALNGSPFDMKNLVSLLDQVDHELVVKISASLLIAGATAMCVKRCLKCCQSSPNNNDVPRPPAPPAPPPAPTAPPAPSLLASGAPAARVVSSPATKSAARNSSATPPKARSAGPEAPAVSPADLKLTKAITSVKAKRIVDAAYKDFFVRLAQRYRKKAQEIRESSEGTAVQKNKDAAKQKELATQWEYFNEKKIGKNIGHPLENQERSRALEYAQKILNREIMKHGTQDGEEINVEALVAAQPFLYPAECA